MSDDLLRETIQLRYPRLLVSGVDYNDTQTVLKRINRFADWCPQWVEMASVHEKLGDQALQEGRAVTAGEAFMRAAIYYHTGQSVYFADPSEKIRVQEMQQAAYRKAMPHLRPDFEAPVGAVLDALSQRPELDAAKFGIWGRSFGCYAAPRGALDPRIAACITIGGFHSLEDVWHRLPVSVHDTFQYGFGVDSHDAARVCAKDYTLEGSLGRLTCPLLIVHSGLDEVCPVEESERIKNEAGGPAELVVFPDGNHVCDNIPYKARPLMADWMARQLGG